MRIVVLPAALASPSRFARTVRHLTPEQIAWRAALLAKRRARIALARVAPKPVRRLAPPPPRGTPPASPFGPREGLLGQDAGGRPVALLQGQEWPLTPPVDWHPTDPGALSRLAKITLHAQEFLAAAGDELFAGIVSDWTRANWVVHPGYWLNSWNGYAISIRTVTWLQGLATRGDGLSEGTRRLLTASAAAQIRFLARNLERDIGGNHLIKNAQALLWAGACFDGPEAARWSALGRRLLARILERQVLADGMHEERSPAYHAQVTADLADCVPVAGPVREPLLAALERMGQALADLTHPDGMVSLFNDGGLRMARPPGEILGVLSELGAGSRPRPAFALAEAGYYGLRTSSQYVLVDCGLLSPDALPAHAHGDVLAFEWSVHGQRVVVDAGVAAYDAGPLREATRATRSHNTVTVGDEDQGELWGSFRLGRRPRPRVEALELEPGRLALTGSHDGYAHLPGAPRHRRSVVADGSGLSFCDEVTGGAGQAVRARVLLHPDVAVGLADGGAELSGPGWRARLEAGVPVRIEDAAWSPDLGLQVPTRRLVLELGAAPAVARWALRLLPGP